jgi:CRISPR-associated endoribonuclease Cas6
MPFSLLVQGYPKTDVPAVHVQGPALQGMFLHLIREVDPALCQRLHDDSKYRPYTLSPLGIGEPTPDPSQEGKNTPLRPPQGGNAFLGFRLPRSRRISAETPCYLRITLLEDMLFPPFSQYFLSREEPTFRLGETEFAVTNVQGTSDHTNPWSTYWSYAELIERASQKKNRRISLRFLTPTSFRFGDVDLPLPFPRLVFRSFMKRFEEFYQVAFLPDFEEQVERYTGISNLYHVNTDMIRTKKVHLIGFTGRVTYEISKKAPPDLVFQMNLLADYAFFCGTGKKTTVGMGQTVRSA